ncbi:MAG: co-chaperone GroES [Planctomycetota bacterium]|jgi:chaperonin GroES|nr:co-chaperone GroES [Planctomycetota bacterium]
MSTTTIAFTPIEDRVLVLPTAAETVSTGGIVLPDSAQEKPLSGTIMAAGPGRYDKAGSRIPMPVANGDEVIFGKYSGTEIEFEGETYKVLRADEILAKIER